MFHAQILLLVAERGANDQMYERRDCLGASPAHRTTAVRLTSIYWVKFTVVMPEMWTV